MILGHGPNTMTLTEARRKLCEQAKLLGKDCNDHLLHGGHFGGGINEDAAAQQSKDAIIYVTVVVVFYVAIVLLLIGTNLRASRATATTGAERRAGRYRKHVVDYSNGRAENKLVTERVDAGAGGGGGSSAGLVVDEEIVEV